MKIMKKYYIVWVLIYLCNPVVIQAVPMQHDTFVWERYLTFPSMMGLTAGLFVYGIFGTPRDLSFQIRQQEKAKKALQAMEYVTVYCPRVNNIEGNDIQKFANQTQHTIVTLHRSNISRISLILLFDQAIKLSPCIVYIVNTDKGMTYDIESSRAFFKEMLNLQVTKKDSLIVLGHAKTQKLRTVHDIYQISFDMTNESPSYQERLEFLQLLLSGADIIDVDMQDMAKKMIGFSYQEILQELQKIQKKSYQCNQQVIEKNIAERSQNIAEQIGDIYKTGVHEMGHAIVTAIYQWKFILHGASVTPQLQKDNNLVGLTQYTRKAFTYKSKDELVDLYEQTIMIFLAGRVAEHIVFGLSDGKKLNAVNGYADLKNNPAGARNDLRQAQENTVQVLAILQKSWKKNMYPLEMEAFLEKMYEKTLNLLLPYKNKLQEGARLLEQHECLFGSQIYNLVYGHDIHHLNS